MNQLYAILMILTGVISVLTYVGGILFAIQKRNTSNRAANYVMMALGILLVAFLLRTFGFAVMQNFFSVAAIGSIAVYVQLVNALVFTVSIGLLVAAAFVDRNHANVSVEEFLPGQQRETLRDNNPYSATSVRDS